MNHCVLTFKISHGNSLLSVAVDSMSIEGVRVSHSDVTIGQSFVGVVQGADVLGDGVVGRSPVHRRLLSGQQRNSLHIVFMSDHDSAATALLILRTSGHTTGQLVPR